ncbi:MAG: hypothetical protein U0835_02070 [Isosphaeraceae bacterium]
MDRPRAYLVRYGLFATVSRFSAEPGRSHTRGEAVVVRSHRGTELGEVLAETAADHAGPSGEVRILRPAGPDDLARASQAERERTAVFQACERVFSTGVWPLEVVDVEVLLDEGKAVALFLGPAGLDVAGLHAVFRNDHGLNLIFENVGADAPDEDGPGDAGHGCGHCGEHGGCGSQSEVGAGCGSSAGCGSCGVKQLLAARR